MSRLKIKKKPISTDLADQTPELLNWLQNAEYNPQYKPPLQQPIITIQGRTILTGGNYMTISGKPKAGKTAFISALIGSALIGANCLGFECFVNSNKNIIHLDTEMGEYEYYSNIEQIKKQSELNVLPGNFKSYKLRGKTAEQIRQAIHYTINHFKPELMVIDGLLDTVIDFNDINECKELTDYLKLITDQTKTAIVCIIHQSRANGYTMGHLGSFADRYSQSVLEVVKDIDTGISTLKPVYLRSAGNFEPINIYFNTHTGTWQYDAINNSNINTQNITIDIIQDNLNIFCYNGILRPELERNICKHFNVKPKKAAEIIKQLFEHNLVDKTGSYYNIKTPF